MDIYQELFYHLVWATKGRMPLITERLEVDLYPYILGKCQALEVHVYALNGMRDHVHLACALPTKLSIADFMHQVKGGSAHFINHLPHIQADVGSCLYWQNGYGVLTLTRRDLPRLISYVENQKTHHADSQLLDKLERTARPPSGGLPALNSPAFQRRDR